MAARPLDSRAPPVAFGAHASDLGAWELASRGPHPVLATVVRAYSGLRGELKLSRELHPPTGEPAIVVNFGPPFRVRDPLDPDRWSWQSGVSVMGPHARPFLAETPAAREILVATLTPGGAHRLLGVAMAELANRYAPLEDLLGAAARRLRDRLCDAASWEARFAILDGFIAARVAAAPRPTREVQGLWLAVRRGARPGAIADDLGVSHKHLISLFRAQVGLTPRLVGRVARFNRALRRVRDSRSAGWAATAQDCGYFDQAHMIRDFRDFAAATPRQLEAMRAAFSFRAG
jgi:AraC-like DNA-binding protein